MTPTCHYAREHTPEQLRTATLAAARHFGTEAVIICRLASGADDIEFVAYEVLSTNARGHAVLGASIIVLADGTVESE